MADIPILIADDSSIMRKILKNALTTCGFTNVAEASDGAEALEKAKGAQFECVLTDWNMPNMDGMELTKQLRKLPNYAKVPIMMVTTEGGKKDVIEALTNGVTSYIVKPFTPDILKERMQELFKA